MSTLTNSSISVGVEYGVTWVAGMNPAMTQFGVGL